MTVFTEQTEQTNPLTTLVGETGKYKSPEELAKGYQNLNEFAENLKREAAELREELGKRLSVEEQVRALANQRTEQPSAPKDPVEPQPHERVKPFTDEDLVARIREELQRTNSEQIAQRNFNEVTSKLVETFGDETKANDFVNQKARELGVSVKFLMEAAQTSPNGFFKIVELDNPTSQTVTTRSDVNTEALANKPGQVKPGTYAFYEQMRKTDPKTYWLPRTQNQMHKEARSNPNFMQ